MPVITKRQRALIGQESEPQPAPLAVNEAMARHWCEMVEDANPIYFDEAYARTTWLQGTFAPPAMLFTWGRPPVWPPGDRLSRLASDRSLRRSVQAVAGTRDYYPVHHDAEFARQSGAQGIF